MRPTHPILIAALSLLVLSTSVPFAVKAEAVTTNLANGGEGPSYDDIDYRGKLFASTPVGKLTSLCVFGETTGTSVSLAIKPSADGSSPLFTTTIQLAASHDWTCASVSIDWPYTSLFVYKTGGNAAIGYDAQSPADSRYSENNGGSWSADSWRRGYKLTILDHGDTVLRNGGVSSSFDDVSFRGKLFPSAPTGTITMVCAYAQTAGTSLVVGLKAAANALPPTATVAISVATGNAWNCQTVAIPWTSSTLFVYKVSGTAAVGYDSGSPTDSRYSDDSGLTWQSDSWRRGYAVTYE